MRTGATMAGYSGTPLAKKLGIKPGHRVAWVNAPATLPRDLGDLPPDVSIVHDGPADVLLWFTTSREALAAALPGLGERIRPAGGLWIGWPKKSSKVPTDVTEDVVRELALPLGLVDNKVCAIDEIWSGLRLVWRLSAR
jgi:hypothetical protein